ncbi:MAG: hypothetical protein JW863_06755 [Chitinispirillaceae bacterium]|nr:hypothetical protein [Chitinispirillaceae bacterium]
MRTEWGTIAAVMAAMCVAVTAQEIDEDALFGDTSLVMIDSTELQVESTAIDGVDSTMVSFSGAVTGVADATASRDWFKERDRREIDPGALMLGDLMLDVRLPFGMKTYTNCELYLAPEGGGLAFSDPDNYFSSGSGSGLAIAVPEIFLDANIDRKVYFRAGKQVLQWGRGYFWNPTDLVNVEKKAFVEKIGSREGTYGVKAHVPFGTKANIYTFIDMNRLSSVDDLAGAARVEGLFGGVEAGVALWGKRGYDPIAGIDFSATLFSWSITGEMSITSGKNYRVLDMGKSAVITGNPANAPLAFKDFGNTAVVRLSAGFMRMFDLLDIDDRVMVVGEFYFNQIGDDGNVFKKYHVGDMIDAVEALPDTSSVKQNAYSALSNAFEFNSLAKYYSAFFVTVNRFLITDMTLTMNGLVNFNHGCAMLTVGVNYLTLHNFSLGCSITGVVGPEESEYALMGTGASVRVTTGMSF